VGTGVGLIQAAQERGIWPSEVRTERLFTGAGVEAKQRGIVGSYADGSRDKVLGVMSKRYNATEVESWNGLNRAAQLAGAVPRSASAFADGSIIVAQYDVGERHGIKSNFVLADSFNGDTKLSAGTTSVRIACTNTLKVALRTMFGFRHTATLEENVKILEVAIAETVREGTNTADTYAKARATRLDHVELNKLFDALFPKAKEDAPQVTRTKAANARLAAKRAALLPINNEGPTLATIWNAATYVVDRDERGQVRPVRGDGSPEASMLFGERGKRVNEVLTMIEVILANGQTQTVTASEALEMGVQAQLVGSKVLDEIIESYVHPAEEA
jgi:hypothetical protein